MSVENIQLLYVYDDLFRYMNISYNMPKMNETKECKDINLTFDFDGTSVYPTDISYRSVESLELLYNYIYRNA